SVSGCPPQVVSTTPSGGAVNVAVATPNGAGQGINVTFNTQVSLSSITGSGAAPGGSTGYAAFYITPAVSGATVSAGQSGNTVTLNLAQNLSGSNTTYTVTLTTAVKNTSNQAMAS